MPYKFSRLKKGYLLLIVVALFTVSLYSTKTVFNNIFNKNENIEEKPAGDDQIDVNETMDYPFEIRWDDTGYESNRPSSITYNLYNVLDENTIVGTVTLTSSNVDNEDSNKWNGVFNSVRKYNDDESEAKYLIKTDYNPNEYLISYSRINYNSLCVEFGDNIFGSNSLFLS